LASSIHDAVAIVGDKDAAIGRNLEAIRPAVIFDHQRPPAVGRDPKNAAERDIDDVEIARSVERRAFDKTIGGLARPVGVGPFRAHALAPVSLRNRRKHLCLDEPRRGVQIHHRVVLPVRTGRTINEHIFAVTPHSAARKQHAFLFRSRSVL
jgi:hypothetical protein